MFLMKEHVGKLISDVEELIYRERKPVESYLYKKAGEKIFLHGIRLRIRKSGGDTVNIFIFRQKL